MVYSAVIKKAIGLVKTGLSQYDSALVRQSALYASHGKHCAAQNAPLVLVACSGGRDSLALAYVTQIVCASLGLRSGAVIVDHNLQANSHVVAQQTAEKCRNFGMDYVRTVSITVEQRGGGIESDARDARYAALCAQARESNAHVVLLAHTQDDQAETIILGLLRSGGLEALSGMPTTVVRDDVLFARPWLELTRADTTAICQKAGLQWWDDPTNAENLASLETVETFETAETTDTAETTETIETTESDEPYPLRSRIRQQLIPYINEFSGKNIVSGLAHQAQQAQEDRDFIEQAAAKLLEQAVIEKTDRDITLNLKVLKEAHPAIRKRVIAAAVKEINPSGVTKHSVEIVDSLIQSERKKVIQQVNRTLLANKQVNVMNLCQDGVHAD